MKKLFTKIIALVAILVLVSFTEVKAQKADAPYHWDTTYQALFNASHDAVMASMKEECLRYEMEEESKRLDSLVHVSAPITKIHTQKQSILKSKNAYKAAKKDKKMADKKVKLADKAYKADHKE